ncbi:histidinol phosphate phosphatase domain-containing protein [Methanobrevibacter sp. DSM 116169]|uniref:histidinol phosphate phosphatase domain-containing protein n=1 Tax=Methanobrevibacter sp. DSM 116169 TaxID=3242727 RepID=UPI0038FC0121
MEKKRIDLHMHSIFSDGELLPSELARRAIVLNHEAIAITDHIDYSNVEDIADIQEAIDDVNKNWDIQVILGAEITHVPTESIDPLAKKAKELGAKIVVVHGETLNEPVLEGTNLAAVKSEHVDVLAHPGLITHDEAKIAKENGIYLEISGRKGHCLANGHVAKIAKELDCNLLINSDSHAPGDLMDFDKAYKVGIGAGLTNEETLKALTQNPKDLIKRSL